MEITKLAAAISMAITISGAVLGAVAFLGMTYVMYSEFHYIVGDVKTLWIMVKDRMGEVVYTPSSVEFEMCSAPPLRSWSHVHDPSAYWV